MKRGRSIHKESDKLLHYITLNYIIVSYKSECLL